MQACDTEENKRKKSGKKTSHVENVQRGGYNIGHQDKRVLDHIPS